MAAAGNVGRMLLHRGVADLRPMPRTLIDVGPRRQVHVYEPSADTPAAGEPVLLVAPLAAPAICFDLRRGCSLVEHLVEGGRPTYLVEYGAVSLRNRELGLDPWVDKVVPDAVRTVSEHAGGKPVHVVGWSLGGIFALLAAAAADLPIASLSVLGSPVDVTEVPMLAPARPLLGDAPAPLRWALPLVPFRQLVGKQLAVATHLDDTEWLAQVEAVDRFTAATTPYRGRSLRAALPPLREGQRARVGDGGDRLALRVAVVGLGSGARLRRRDRRDRPGRRGAPGPVLADRRARRTVRDRAGWSPRDAHRPGGAGHHVAGAGRVVRAVVGRRTHEEAGGSEEGARQEGRPLGGRDRVEPEAPALLGQLARPAEADGVADFSAARFPRPTGESAASLPPCPTPQPCPEASGSGTARGRWRPGRSGRCRG